MIAKGSSCHKAVKKDVKYSPQFKSARIRIADVKSGLSSDKCSDKADVGAN